MDFFGIGAEELVLILLVFFIFFGPTKLPEVAAMMGKAMRKLKQASAEMNRNLQEMSDDIKEAGKESGSPAGGKGIVSELKDATRELSQAARDVKDTANIPATLKKDLKEVSRDLTSAARETPAPEKKPEEAVAAEAAQGEKAPNAGKEARS